MLTLDNKNIMPTRSQSKTMPAQKKTRNTETTSTGSQSKKTPPQKTPVQKRSRNTETTLTSKKTIPQKMPPAGSKSTATGTKRKRTNSGSNPSQKRTKTGSSSEARPLTTADIPRIVAAIADAHWREVPDARKGS